MGSPKLLLPWADTTILGHLLQQWRKAGARHIAIVCAEENAPLRHELDRLDWPADGRIINPRPQEGMFSSIQCAARWSGWPGGLTHWIITLGDQPQVRFPTLRALLELGAANAGSICQPSRQGRARHPVLLPAALFMELGDASEGDLKAFLLKRAPIRVLAEVDDPGLDFDLDQPADYERALRMMSGTT